MTVVSAVSLSSTYVKHLCSNCSKLVKLTRIQYRRNISIVPIITNTLIDSKKMMPEDNNSKKFKFTNYDCIGFDLDNTVARYKVGAMIEMEYEIMANFLINRGYSKEHLKKPFDHNFILKGLIVDDDNGNLLRIAHDGLILQASHGTRMLTDDEIKNYYPQQHWKPSDSFAENPISTWNGPSKERMRALLDYFDIAAGLIFARAVDSIDEKKGTNNINTKYNVLPDIVDSLQEMFIPEHFQTNRGEYFEKMKSNPDKYYYKCSDNLLNWLRMLKKSGKTLFLITGSHVDFASHTATNTIGPNWRDYFDIVICYAKKPGFFSQNRKFKLIDGFRELNEISSDQLKLGGIYSYGNWRDLYEFLTKNINKTNPKFLYIGDNLIQDIYTPTNYTQCDTVTICEELEAEGEHGHEPWHPDKQFLISTVWGSYFKCKNQYTNWYHIMMKHSKLCVPSLEYIAALPLDKEYINHSILS